MSKERLDNETLDNAISAYKTVVKFAEDIIDEDYLTVLDKVTLAFLEELKQYRDLEEQGLPLRLPCKEGDTVWELCKCDDDVYRIFPMTVGQVAQYGSIRWVKGKEPTVWNIYATSDYTYMYKSFYDIGRTVFLTKSEAEEKLRELEEK